MASRRFRHLIAGAATMLTAGAALAPVAHAAPTAATPPPGCDEQCEQAFSKDLPNNVRLEGWRKDGAFSVLAYYIGEDLQDVTELPEFEQQGVLGAECGWDGDASRCAVTYFTGAHSEGASSVLLTADRGIEITSDALGGAPGAVPRDLNGDGRVDVAVRQSTYEPSYAEAPQYWETYEEQDGQLRRTGCTDPVKGSTPEPTELLTGHCFR